MAPFSGPIRPLTGPSGSEKPAISSPPNTSNGFAGILHERLVFSQHATSRMQIRGIRLTQNQRSELNQAVNAAKDKGSKKAAVIMGSDIFIVAPQSRTVITSVSSPQDGMKVITQVDAVVYVSRTSTDSQKVTEEAQGIRQTANAPSAPHWSLLSLPKTGEDMPHNS